MAWRPTSLIEGELDNRVPGKVTGWMRFFRGEQQPLRVTFDLTGDFHEDIRGMAIRLRGNTPSDRNADLDRQGTYMAGFSSVQRGSVGDITAGLPLGKWDEALSGKIMAQHELAWTANGLTENEKEERRKVLSDEHRAQIAAGELCYAYVPYPYVEWYSVDNGRVVIELEPSQVVIVPNGNTPRPEKTPGELLDAQRKRSAAFAGFMTGMVERISRENRKHGGNGNVTGVVIE